MDRNFLKRREEAIDQGRIDRIKGKSLDDCPWPLSSFLGRGWCLGMGETFRREGDLS
jgi:hypothetical protein